MKARPLGDQQKCAGPHSFLSAARFAVLADPHLLDSALIAEGTDLGRHLSALKQMIGESESIFEQAVGQVLSEAPDFVLVCGDLTKDGEESSHRL